MSITTMAKQYGYINGLIPMAAALSVIGSEAYHRAAATVSSGQNTAWNLKALYSLVSISIIFQFVVMRYDFHAQIPPPASLDAGNRILGVLKISKSPVFIPTSPYLLYMVNQPTHFQVSSLGDLELAAKLNPKIEDISKKYLDEIHEYLSSKSIKTVILPSAKWYDEVFSLKNKYHCKSLVVDQPPLITVVGAISYLDRICRFRGVDAK